MKTKKSEASRAKSSYEMFHEDIHVEGTQNKNGDEHSVSVVSGRIPIYTSNILENSGDDGFIPDL